MAYKIVRTRTFCIVYRITVDILVHYAFEADAQAKSLIRRATFVTECLVVLNLRHGYHNMF